MGKLSWQLCDSQGAAVDGLEDRIGGQVAVGINDLRNGTVTLSIDDPAVPYAFENPSRLKAFIDDAIILNAPVFLPHAEGAGGSESTVSLSATDNIQLAAAFTFGFPVLTGYDQGQAIYQLAIHSSGPQVRAIVTGVVIPLAGASVPDHGIIAGSIPATANVDRTYYDGTNIWDSIIELVGIDGGVDFELEPLDRDDGVFMQLNTFNRRQGSDKSADVLFEVGTGRDNADGWTWEPSKEQMVNYYVLAGQTDTTDATAFCAVVQHGDSQDLFGLYQGFEVNADVPVSNEAVEKAVQVVGARAYPIDTFTITPAVEQGGTAALWARDPTGAWVQTGEGYGVPPAFGPGADYWLGDTISALVKQGQIQGNFPGRVTAATLTEVDGAGNAAVELTCTPKDRYNAGVTTVGGFVTLGPAQQFSADASVDTSEPQDTSGGSGGGGGSKKHKKHHKRHHKKHH
jgi:hypothetical protein